MIAQATDRAVEAVGEPLERDEKRREPEEMGEDARGEISGNPLDLSSAKKALADFDAGVMG